MFDKKTRKLQKVIKFYLFRSIKESSWRQNKNLIKIEIFAGVYEFISIRNLTIARDKSVQTVLIPIENAGMCSVLNS